MAGAGGGGDDDDDYYKLHFPSRFPPPSSGKTRPTTLIPAVHHELTANASHHNVSGPSAGTTASWSSDQRNSPVDTGPFILTSSTKTSQRREKAATPPGSTTQTSNTDPVIPSRERAESQPVPKNPPLSGREGPKRVAFQVPPSQSALGLVEGGGEKLELEPGEHRLSEPPPAGEGAGGIMDKEMEEDKKVTTSTAVRNSSPVPEGLEPLRKGTAAVSSGQNRRRRSRSPGGGDIMREIRKMSLASQDAREKKKGMGSSGGTVGGRPDSARSSGPGAGPGQPPLSSPSSTKGGGKRSVVPHRRRRKRKEEEYTDKDRAAAVTLGSRDIKQSLKAKKKRERKLRISVDLLHNEEFLSGMLVVEAAYQERVKGQTPAALATLNKALELQPTHRAALVARSQCHLKLGDATAALRDAEASFDGNDVYIMGLYQYAEALYNLGQFEKALIAYHRGHRIRKLDSFRIGIQKCEDAIHRAIGDCSATPGDDLEEILPLIDELEVSAMLRKDSGKLTLPKDGTTKVIQADEVPAQSKQETSIMVGTAAEGQCDRRMSESLDGCNVSNGSSSLRNTKFNGGQMNMSGTAQTRWISREILGKMYFDKDYLASFLRHEEIRSDRGASHQLQANAAEALHYLEVREEFWRQQNPLYTRKNGSRAINKDKK